MKILRLRLPKHCPQSDLKYEDTVAATNVNNLEINIQPVGNDAAHVNDISLHKFEENQYVNNEAASDGTISNQKILQTQSYDATFNAQDASEYLDPSVLPVQGTVTGGSVEGILLNSEIENNPTIRNVGLREFNNPNDAQQTWVLIHGWNDTPDGRFTDLAQEIAAAHSGDRVSVIRLERSSF